MYSTDSLWCKYFRNSQSHFCIFFLINLLENINNNLSKSHFSYKFKFQIELHQKIIVFFAYFEKWETELPIFVSFVFANAEQSVAQ